MREVIREMGSIDQRREVARANKRLKRGESGAATTHKPCKFRYALPEVDASVEVCFQNSAVEVFEKAAVVKVLRTLLVKLEEE
jgi:hypothetical protein